MGPFCPEQGTSSHVILKDLASTDEKNTFSGGDVGSEREISKWNYKIKFKKCNLSNSPTEMVITIIPLSKSMVSVPNIPANNEIVQ